MIQFQKMTMEEALLKTLKDDPRAAGLILSAQNGDHIVCSFVQRYEVPANFAKAVLADYVKEGAQQG